ncbi:hypothetical protein MNBD_NITROSPINAE02-1764 [hydrothermal vent metagenome]|uniref:Capsule polysaccharide biosynthesis protein n=1 Tax=hydrothermal vent metagenome TaxID=652676 RepID=A0A3B1CIB8_9ZZZZ
MKFLFVVRNPSFFTQYEGVVNDLCERGNKVHFLLYSLVWKNWRMGDEALSEFKAKSGGLFDYEQIPDSFGLLDRVLKAKRSLVNYAGYLKNKNPISTSPYLISRAKNLLPATIGKLVSFNPVKKFIASEFFLKVGEWIEGVAPLNKVALRLLKKIEPDAVIASPFIFPNSKEIEYIKCARELGIPTAALIFSWDNLTTKGLFQFHPDSVIVWNKLQVKELVEIHNVEEEKTVSVGAPSLDYWFGRKPTRTYEQFCEEANLPPSRPFIIYLCSSQNIAKDENVFADEFISYLRKSLGDECPSILVRPHPMNQDIWEGFNAEGTVVYPRENRTAYAPRSRADFFDTLYHSSCIVGLNTTAIIEAAIVGKPCVTLISSRYSSTQSDTRHFNLLLDAGFLYVANDFAEAQEAITLIIAGGDKTGDKRYKFVNEFIRPLGMSQPVAPILGKTLEGLANQQN